MIAPHDHNDQWDTGDVDELRRLYQSDDKFGISFIAQCLGRTAKAVKSKLYRESIKRK